MLNGEILSFQNQNTSLPEMEKRTSTKRTTEALPRHAEMQLEKQKLHLNKNWSEMSKTVRKGSLGTQAM